MLRRRYLNQGANTVNERLSLAFVDTQREHFLKLIDGQDNGTITCLCQELSQIIWGLQETIAM